MQTPQQLAEIANTRNILATDESLVAWIKGIHEREMQRKVYNDLPARFRRMVDKGVAVKAQIAMPLHITDEQKQKARTFLEEKLKTLEAQTV